MDSSTTGEKLTAAVSALVAIAILGAAVTAQQGRATHADRLANLESDVRFQFELSYGYGSADHAAHIVELESTLAAWRGSLRTPADDRLLVEWLVGAIDQTLPGETGELPPLPAFSAPTPPEDASADDATEADDSLRLTTLTPELSEADGATLSDGAFAHGEAAEGGDTGHAPSMPELAPAPGSGESDGKPATLADADPGSYESIPADEEAADDAASGGDASGEATDAEEHSIAQDPAAPEDEEAAFDAPKDAATGIEAAAHAALDPTPKVAVNLAELDARIAGYHQELAAIEAGVFAKGERTRPQLEALVARLETLAVQCQFVRLYFDTLTDAEQRRVTEPREMADAIALVRRQVDQLEGSGDFLSEFETPAGAEPTLAARLRKLSDALSDGQ